MINKPISFDPYLVVNQYACQDGGILVNGLNNIRKYDANMNLVWDRNVPYMINNATATLANGFYIYTTSFINNKTIIEIKRLKDDGSVEWSSDITAFTSNVTDIQTTSDDGVIVGTNNGLRKYSAKGQLLWNNLSIVNATKFMPLDADRMYIQVQNSSLNNILGILQINTQNGTNIWTKNFASESIVDFEITIAPITTAPKAIKVFEYQSSEAPVCVGACPLITAISESAWVRCSVVRSVSFAPYPSIRPSSPPIPANPPDLKASRILISYPQNNFSEFQDGDL
jgi:hypothetical protein